MTDDKAARRHAATLKVACSGTLGCLILGVESNLWTIGDANEWLKQIVATGYHSPVADLADLVIDP